MNPIIQTPVDTGGICDKSTRRLRALCEAVADPSGPAFTLTADNERGEWLDDLDGVTGGEAAFVVTLRRDVLAFDADDARLAAVVERIATELVTAGHPVLRVASGRPGHLHLWTVIRDAVERERVARRAQVLGLPPRSTMRPPGSPHRLGLSVHLLDDADEWLAEVAARRADVAPSRSWRDLLRTGRWWTGHRGDASGSAMVWHIAIGARRAGWSVDMLAEALADTTNVGGASYRARLDRPGGAHGDRWLRERVWPRACEAAERRSAPSSDDDALAELDRLTAAVEAHRWRGVGGATERAIMLVLLEAGRRTSTLSPTMSTRTIAERARVRQPTVVAASRRLRDAGWLLVAERGRGHTVMVDGVATETTAATRWRLTVPPEVVLPVSATAPARGCTTRDPSSTTLLDDLGRWRGIGLNGARIVEMLTAESLTADTIAERLRLDRRHVRRCLLPRLRDLGLLRQTDTMWQVVENLTEAVDTAGDLLRCTGKAAAQRAQHRRERAAYLDHRERTREARACRKRAHIAAWAQRQRERRQPSFWPARTDHLATPAQSVPMTTTRTVIGGHGERTLA